MGLLTKIFPSWAKSQEGMYRPGPWQLPVTGGWLPHDVGINLNWWQNGYDPVGGGTSAMVEACVSAYSQTVAMCSGDHWLVNDKGGRERVTNSALSRILKKPNDYQSISDFILNLTRNLYCHGDAFALALRNDRYEIKELHLMSSRNSRARVAITGEIFYQLAGNEIIENRIDGELIVPARDVLHVRLHTPRHPLEGVSPMEAAAMDIAASAAMTNQLLTFYLNQSRPSTVLTTDMVLDKQQIETLREAWNEQSRGLNSGGTPILTGGLKPLQLASTARDSQLADVMKLGDQHIALVYRIPLQILGIGGTAYSSTELLMQSWIASGLGFALNHIEEAFGQLFQLKGLPTEYLEFNTSVLQRSALKDRVESFASGTRAGIYAPNEARAEFELPRVPDGDDPRMQQQDVPLSYGADLEPPKPAAPAEPPGEKPSEPEPDDGEANDNERARKFFRASHGRHVAP